VRERGVAEGGVEELRVIEGRGGRREGGRGGRGRRLIVRRRKKEKGLSGDRGGRGEEES